MSKSPFLFPPHVTTTLNFLRLFKHAMQFPPGYLLCQESPFSLLQFYLSLKRKCCSSSGTALGQLLLQLPPCCADFVYLSMLYVCRDP